MNKKITKSEKFWLKKSYEIEWEKKPKIAYIKKLDNHFVWFPDGKINLYKNLIENNLKLNKYKECIILISSKNEVKKLNYYQIDLMVDNFLMSLKKKNNNTMPKKIIVQSSASIYSCIPMLACCKAGIFFSIIFEDLPPEAVYKRLSLFKPELVITKKKSVISFLKKNKNFKNKVINFKDLNFSTKAKKKFKSKILKSSKNFFSLFTSGSTGEPKGIVHNVGGYSLYTKYTCQTQFGMSEHSTVLTASDAGWINGHTYALFGPLLCNSTTILIEKPLSLLNPTLINKVLSFNTSILYFPVTLIRLLKSVIKSKTFKNHSVKTLGSMGEPLAKDIGAWFAKCFNLKEKAIINTYFQTETGGIISSPTFKENIYNSPHGCVGNIVNNNIKIQKLSKIQKKEILIKNTWPGCMSSILNKKTVWNKYWTKSGFFRMFDLGTIKKKNIYIHGRVDDVINIRGHRIGSEEIESIILSHDKIIECCAVSTADYYEGMVFNLFIVCKGTIDKNDINNLISKNFGHFALPKNIFFVKELPKTRSGKILRRLIRDILITKKISKNIDLSTMLNSYILKHLVNVIKNNG